MKPRRRVIFIAAMVLLVLGLVLCGPVHHALHSDHGGDSGDLCDGCNLNGLEAPAFDCVTAPVIGTSERIDSPRLRAPSAQRRLFHSPRGPPAHA